MTGRNRSGFGPSFFHGNPMHSARLEAMKAQAMEQTAKVVAELAERIARLEQMVATLLERSAPNQKGK